MSTYRLSTLFIVVAFAAVLMLVPQANAADISAASQAVLDTVDLSSPTGCSQIYGFNYQPSWGSNGLAVWGDDFNAAQYRTELTRGKEYFPEFNAVRIWLSWSAYRADPQQFVNNFQQAVDVCGDLDLLVVPVMFNRWVGNPLWDMVEDSEITSDYNTTFTPYINDIVTPMQGDSRILAWDLCNEPPLGNSSEVSWLTNVRDTVKQIDPQALTCIGTVTVEQTAAVAHLEDILTPHLYPAYLPRVGEYMTLATNQSKPLMSTECCWGSLDDAERAAFVRHDLNVLKQNGIGFFPHALQESYVADLHRPEYGPVGSPGYMAFIHMDGTLRAGHEVYNEFTQEPAPVESPFVIDDHALEHSTGTTVHSRSAVSPGFSISGTWTEGYYPGAHPAVGGGYSWPSNPATDTATYTPGELNGFESGSYDVYVSWGVWSGNDGATYTVNHAGGTQVFNFDNQDNASQGAVGALESNLAGSGSGFYLLGTFDLDAVSNIVFSGNGQVDAVMFRDSDDGRFIDHQSANLTVDDPSAWTMSPSPTSSGTILTDTDLAPSGSYYYTLSDETATWTDLVEEAGTYNLKVSWGVHAAHSDNVKYLVDIDGNGLQDAGDSLLTINQSKRADQLTDGNIVWSDYYELGSFDLTADSQILQWNEGTGAMTVAPMLVVPTSSVPEPSTLGLLLSLGIFAYCIRTRRCPTAKRGSEYTTVF